jgi:hypothetical protein
MQIGLPGLGRMGMNMGRRLLQGKHRGLAVPPLPLPPDGFFLGPDPGRSAKPVWRT